MQIIIITIIAAATLITTTSFKKKQKVVVINNAKTIQKNLKEITPTMFAWQTEVSNAQYSTFIKAMQIANNSEYTQYVVDSTGWRTATYNNDPYVNNYHKHPAFANYPVVNISYANANAYCNWLTTLYNNDASRKYKKVQFTLPTIEEWETAASGGRSKAIYSWGSYYTRSRKGTFMGNFRMPFDATLVTDSATGLAKQVPNKTFGNFGTNADKAFYTASCNSFWPNDYGLYNCSGNVAEMISTEGIAKGGSWHNFSGEVTIQSQQQYTKPNPEVGFRAFMKVLEL